MTVICMQSLRLASQCYICILLGTRVQDVYSTEGTRLHKDSDHAENVQSLRYTMNPILEEHLALISHDCHFMATPASGTAVEEKYAIANIGKVRAVLHRARVYTVVAGNPSLSTN